MNTFKGYLRKSRSLKPSRTFQRQLALPDAPIKSKLFQRPHFRSRKTHLRSLRAVSSLSNMASNKSFLLRPIFVFTVLSLVFPFASSHEHHDEELPPGQVITFDPVDGILWTHIFFMALSFGILFPTGMVLSPDINILIL